MIIPGTAKEVITALMEDYGYSIEDIAHAISTSKKTLCKILQNNVSSPEINLYLVILYLQIKAINEIKKEKKHNLYYLNKRPMTLKTNSQFIFQMKKIAKKEILLR